jgi:hypothetical protein
MRSIEIEATLATTNELLLTRLSRDRSDAECEETAAIVREITQIRDKMLVDPYYDPTERTQMIEKMLQSAPTTI